MDSTTQDIIRQTRHWIKSIVVELNLCPFAADTLQDDSIDYQVITESELEQDLQQLAECFKRLDETTDSIETSLLIFADRYEKFDDYLELLYLANHLLDDLNYSGTYQIASFHPDYQFEGSTVDDAANFTNRSPYPMLHILREHSLEKAIESYPDIDKVPENNIVKLEAIGYTEMQQRLRDIIDPAKVSTNK